MTGKTGFCHFRQVRLLAYVMALTAATVLSFQSCKVREAEGGNDDDIPVRHELTFSEWLEKGPWECMGGIYSDRSGKLFWTDSISKARREELIALLNDPADFDLQPLSGLFPSEFTDKILSALPDSLGNKVYALELAHLMSLESLIQAAKSGVNDKKAELPVCDSLYKTDDLSRVLAASDLFTGLLEILPSRLSEIAGLMRTFRNSDVAGYPGYEIPAFKSDSAVCVAACMEALVDYGLLAASDSAVSWDEFQAALKIFQGENGLEPDGKIGDRTRAAFGRSYDYRLNQIKANMERVRPGRQVMPSEYIYINIPEFRLRYYRGSEVIAEHKVITGKRKNFQTPSFSAYMKEIVINPRWNVPYSISTKELLPSQKADASYLRNHNYVVYDRSRNVVDPSTVDWSKVSAGNFPYNIVQVPGSFNALGRIKFLFPNSYSIYLHDTPSKNLFAREQRDFSHGCIRLQNPLDLGVMILDHDRPPYDREMMDAMLDSLSDHSIALKTPILVIVDYSTVRSEEDRRFIFYEDVYGRDEAWMKERELLP